jgi:hypothetical protein
MRPCKLIICSSILSFGVLIGPSSYWHCFWTMAFTHAAHAGLAPLQR